MVAPAMPIVSIGDQSSLAARGCPGESRRRSATALEEEWGGAVRKCERDDVLVCMRECDDPHDARTRRVVA